MAREAGPEEELTLDGATLAAVITACGTAATGLLIALPNVVKAFREAKRDSGEDYQAAVKLRTTLRKVVRALSGTSCWDTLDEELRKELEEAAK